MWYLILSSLSVEHKVFAALGVAFAIAAAGLAAVQVVLGLVRILLDQIFAIQKQWHDIMGTWRKLRSADKGPPPCEPPDGLDDSPSG